MGRAAQGSDDDLGLLARLIFNPFACFVRQDDETAACRRSRHGEGVARDSHAGTSDPKLVSLPLPMEKDLNPRGRSCPLPFISLSQGEQQTPPQSTPFPWCLSRNIKASAIRCCPIRALVPYPALRATNTTPHRAFHQHHTTSGVPRALLFILRVFQKHLNGT